ncbi:type II toxin-antitoxin system RelE/ParE family toxin [Candidatus Woesearchaeota archaeon]|nr:type II toxin-antitoxin system RelE/ParE family toxin [Candidatus Woesearchaeota archaeon]
MFSIDITRTADRFLSKLPKKDKEIILNKLYSIRFRPFHFVKKLEGTRLWRLRISDYRAVLDIIISGNKITVVRIGHRKNIYSRL